MAAYDDPTLRFYASEAAAYVDRPDELPAALSNFLDRLPSGARILELGCGGGREARHMLDRGFDVDATDGVAEMAREAEAWLGRPVRVMRFDQLDAHEAYDAVIANASLLHVPLDELGSVIARIWQALKPGGWHLASYKTGKAEGRDDFGRYYNQLTRDDADRMYRAAGDWALTDYAEDFWDGYFGQPSAWITVTARKS